MKLIVKKCGYQHYDYRCPHQWEVPDRIPQHGFCIFHHPKLTEEQKAKLASDKRVEYQFEIEEEFRRKFSELLNNMETDESVKVCDFPEFQFPSIDLGGREFKKPCTFYQASFSGGADFRRAKFSGEADFRGASFGGGADFRNSRFSGVSFSDASFSEKADFRRAEFSGGADFRNSRFSEVSFDDASFSGETTFRIAEFCRGVNFINASFSRGADFRNSRFSGVIFSGASFSGKADFRSASFSGGATFYNVKFSGQAYFLSANFSKRVSFDDASFSGEADFSSANFSKGVSFDDASFSGEASFSKKAPVSFTSLKLEKDALVSFEKVDLGRASFLDTNLEQTTFRGVKWHHPPKTLIRRRQALWDEFRPLERDQARDYEKLAENYRQLVLNYERKRAYDSAEDFHNGEMEMRRKKKGQAGKSQWSRKLREWVNAYALYKVLSNYGTSYWQALIVLLILFLVFSWISLLFGFQTISHPVELIEYDFLQDGQHKNVSLGQ